MFIFYKEVKKEIANMNELWDASEVTVWYGNEMLAFWTVSDL